MINKLDIDIINNIKKDINKRITSKGTQIDWDLVNQLQTLDELVHCLKIAEHSYKPVSEEDKYDNFFTAECLECGWWGSSRLVEGGHPIADTGDYSDPVCPVCYSDEIEEKQGQ